MSFAVYPPTVPYQGTSKPTSLLVCRKIHLTPFSSKNTLKFLSEFVTTSFHDAIIIYENKATKTLF